MIIIKKIPQASTTHEPPTQQILLGTVCSVRVIHHGNPDQIRPDQPQPITTQIRPDQPNV